LCHCRSHLRITALDGRRYHLTAAGITAIPKIDRQGLGSALGAYIIWGFMPLFFKQLDHVPPYEIIAHRILWAVPLLILIMAFRRQLTVYRNTFFNWPLLRWMLASAVLISVNWLIYVWAVNNDHILAASFGYYLNPLLNILVGMLFLKERLNKIQVVAVAIANIGVIIMGSAALDTLWISLGLAASFSIYGLVRKIAPVDAVPGLAIETSLLLPIALFGGLWYMNQGSQSGWHHDVQTTALLVAGGAITAIPLLLFATAARRMSYTALGFIQYIGPTIQFLLAVLIYGEDLTLSRILSFALIWLALTIFTWDAVHKMRLS
jgi:chloramphenicol-sensitive protein RarD